jgi:hypothetical protein
MHRKVTKDNAETESITAILYVENSATEASYLTEMTLLKNTQL